MSEKSLFFDSVGGDRKYSSSDFTTYFSKVLTDGVFPNPATNLQVVANGNMTVTVKPGGANIKGYLYNLTENKIITIEPATATRKDSIVVRWDIGQRKISIEYKQGIIEPTRTVSIYELVLAEITVNAGASSISQGNIYDTRQITAKCGLVNSLIEADTTELFAGFEEGFNTWFDTVKGVLSGDTAGNLQNQINTLSENKAEKSSIDTLNTNKADKTDINNLKLQIADKANNNEVIKISEKGVSNGIASLDKNGYIKEKIHFDKLANPTTTTSPVIIYQDTISNNNGYQGTNSTTKITNVPIDLDLYSKIEVESYYNIDLDWDGEGHIVRSSISVNGVVLIEGNQNTNSISGTSSTNTKVYGLKENIEVKTMADIYNSFGKILNECNIKNGDNSIKLYVYCPDGTSYTAATARITIKGYKRA